MPGAPKRPTSIKHLEEATEALSYEQCLAPAMAITEAADAAHYLEALVRYHVRIGGCAHTRASAVARDNLGYWAGYYDAETRARVERLFECAHPVLGAIAIKGQPTASEAYRAGWEFANRRWGRQYE